jgi:hypothetical protein
MGGGPMSGYGSSGGGMVWPGSPPQANSYDFPNDPYGGPLSRLKESVNSLEALNAMEKSISEQVRLNIEMLPYVSCLQSD